MRNLPPIRVVENHHEVLPCWQEAQQAAGHPLAVITFDHHTDTLPCFGRLDVKRQTWWLGQLLKLPWSSQLLQQAVTELRHDEHFDLALKIGLVSQVFMFASTTTTILPPGITLLADPDISRCEIIPSGDDPVWRSWCRRALETSFLRQLSRDVQLPESDYIVDIDLDYFKCPEALQPKNGELFRHWVQNARMLTISRESQWVKLLGCDRTWNASQALDLLLKLIEA